MIPFDTSVILHRDPWLGHYPVKTEPYMIYTTWNGAAWELRRLHIATGTEDTGPSFDSYIRAVRAWRGGVTWR